MILPFFRALEAQFRREGWQVKSIRSFVSFAEVELQHPGESEVLRLDLALDSPFQLEPLQPTAFHVFIPSYHDLVVSKRLAFFGRTEPRDAVDRFFILQREQLEPLLEMAARKHPGFDLHLVRRCIAADPSIPR